MSTPPKSCTKCGTPHTFQPDGSPYRCGNCGHSETPPSVDEFLALREDWYANGTPRNHPYAEMLADAEARRIHANAHPTPVAPLVTFR